MKHELKRYSILINLSKCTGCYSCQVSCKAEHGVPFGHFRCKVDTITTGVFPSPKKFFIPKLCNQCADAPCIKECADNSIIKTNNGIVLINKEQCAGCAECIEVCPYGAIYYDEYMGMMDKCDFCIKRVSKGLRPVCVENCMGGAMLFGDAWDKKSSIHSAIHQGLSDGTLKVLNPEYNSFPSIFYLLKGDDPSGNLKRLESIEPAHTLITPVEIDLSGGKAKKEKIVHTSDVMCPSECGISVLVEGGVAKKIYGNPHTLVNSGAVCAKGAAGLQLTYSPYRIKTPLMRTGKRGDDTWKSVSWDDAAEYIAKKLIHIKKTYGPESVFLDCGDVTDREAYYRLFHAYGTPNTYNHGSICDPNRRWGTGLMMGDERPLPDLQRPVLIRDENGNLIKKLTHDAKLILHIGVNPFVSTRFNYMSRGITGARVENSCRYIVVDPSYTNSAAHADLWLPIRPGTDAGFLAAILHYIITHDEPSDSSRCYIDHTFLRDYTTGWEEFKSAFLEQSKKKDPLNGKKFFSLEWAQEKTGIDSEKIRAVSHELGITKPAAIEIGMHGTAHHTNGDVTSILMSALCIITGNVDIPGGLVFIDSQKPGKGYETSANNLLNKNIERTVNGKSISGTLRELHKDFYGDFPAAWKGVLSDIPGKVKDGVTISHGPFEGYEYPVKAFFARAGNPLMSAGNTTDWKNAFTLKNGQGDYLLDLLVFIDTHINETGTFADIVLPEAGFLERMGLSDVYTFSPEVALRDQVIQPLYESKTPFEIMMSIAGALSTQGDSDINTSDFRGKYKSEEDFINEILKETPSLCNAGDPLPYQDLPEGALIIGVPENPTAIKDGKIVKEGDPVTVEWLRGHNGVGIWPASYRRYRKSDGTQSMFFPKTATGKFEFVFSRLESINKEFGTCYPTTFYWEENRWNPNNIHYADLRHEYPFQLISGRAHHAMTATQVCPALGETETECMKPLNKPFKEIIAEPSIGDGGDVQVRHVEKEFSQDSFSIPVFTIHTLDGEKMGIRTGDTVILENPQKKRITGNVFLSDGISPGVIKTVFGSGGRWGSGMGISRKMCDYTPNINELTDPENLSPFTGMPGFADVMVKIIKTQKRG